MGPYPPEAELAQHTNPSQSENGRRDWDFHTVRRVINPDDIRVRPRVVGVVDACGWIATPGRDPIVPA